MDDAYRPSTAPSVSPGEWLDDPARSGRVGVPDGTVHRTKPQLALAMLGRTLDAGAPARVVADEVCGSGRTPQRALEARGQA